MNDWLRCPGNHRGGGVVLEINGFDDLPDQHRVPAPHVNAGAWPTLVVCVFLQGGHGPDVLPA